MDSEEYSPTLLDILWDKNPRRAFISLAQLFLDTTDVERAQIRSDWDFGREWSIPRLREIDMDHAVFGPVEGVDENGNTAEELLTGILVHIVLRGPSDDYRDDIAHEALIHHCALEAGVDPEALFARVANVAGEPFATGLIHFQQRKPKDKSLYAFGYRKRRIGRDIEFEWFGNDADYLASEPTRLDRYGAVLEI